MVTLLNIRNIIFTRDYFTLHFIAKFIYQKIFWDFSFEEHINLSLIAQQY